MSLESMQLTIYEWECENTTVWMNLTNIIVHMEIKELDVENFLRKQKKEREFNKIF